MSFGGFKFGSGSNSAPSSSTIPQFSLTAPTPTVQPASSFSFGSAPQPPANQTNQQQAPGQAAAPAAGTSLLGGFGQQNQNQTQNQPAQGQQQQGQQTGGLFGGGSSLFGSKPAQQSTPAPGRSSLFGGGSSLFGTQTQQQPAQTTQPSSLFGQSTNQPQQSSLFGQTTTQPQQSSLFGQSNTQPNPQAGTGLFGSTAQAPKPAGSLFQSTSQPQPSLFSSQNRAPQLGQSTSGNSSGLNKNTRFTDLPEPAQRAIEQLDAFFKQQKDAGKGINSEPLGQAIKQTSLDVKAATEESSALTQGLASLQMSLKQLKDKFDAEEMDLRKVAEIWDTYRSIDGRPGAVRVAAHRDFPHEFFARAAASMQERAGRYRKTIAQLQRVVVSLSSSQESVSPHAVAQTIQSHQNAILSLAAQLEQLQIRMNSLRSIFTEDYQERTDSMRDPFEVAREEKGLAPLRV